MFNILLVILGVAAYLICGILTVSAMIRYDKTARRVMNDRTEMLIPITFWPIFALLGILLCSWNLAYRSCVAIGDLCVYLGTVGRNDA